MTTQSTLNEVKRLNKLNRKTLDLTTRQSRWFLAAALASADQTNAN